jgi:hypothetical protein
LTLLGIVDDGGASDPLSSNTLVAFEITSDVADPATPGDANLDAAVDAADVAILAASYGTMSGARWEDADFDGDGRVTVGDLALLGKNLPIGERQESSAAESLRRNDEHIATPEPGTVALIAAAAALFAAGWMWRRSIPKAEPR